MKLGGYYGRMRGLRLRLRGSEEGPETVSLDGEQETRTSGGVSEEEFGEIWGAEDGGPLLGESATPGG